MCLVQYDLKRVFSEQAACREVDFARIFVIISCWIPPSVNLRL